MKKIALVLLLTPLLLTFGCASTYSKGTLASSSLSTPQIKQALNKQLRSWKGVRYKMGGTDRSGVDCSGFIYKTFKDRVGVNLPRSTELQSKRGHFISKKDLRAGDLVFFKTGSFLKSRHVGIYTGNNQFIHASTSRGVMRSSLKNSYWKKAYWHSRRVLK